MDIPIFTKTNMCVVQNKCSDFDDMWRRIQSNINNAFNFWQLTFWTNSKDNFFSFAKWIFRNKKHNRFQRKPFNSTKKITIFYDLTMEKKVIMCNDQISLNFCILSKTKRQLNQSRPSYENFSKENKQCSNKSKFVWTKYLNCTLINIKDNNSLSTIQETTLAF